MKLALGIILGLAPITAATAESDWLFIGREGNTNAAVFASKDDIAIGRSNQNQAKVWMASIFNPKFTTTKSSKTLLQFNCPNRVYKILSVTLFHASGRNETSTPAYPKEEHIIRGSIIQGVADQVCVN